MLSPQNPLKKVEDLLDDKSRLELLELAIKDDNRFKICDVETYLSKPSYTINTLDYLKTTYSEFEFSMIMGADSYHDLYKWRSYKRILNENKIYVYPRGKEPVYSGSGLYNIEYLKNAPLFDLSATYIRGAIKDNINLKYFIPEEVHKCILENNFYRK